MEYTILKALGVKDIDQIERYAVRTEGESDILKIYYEKKKGQLFHKSEKFKFSRTYRGVRSSTDPSAYKDMSEVSPMLTKVMAELDDIVDQEHQEHQEQDAKKKILTDLRHLEKVVKQKIQEIEVQLDKL
jgi:uncharacterized protein DUF3461